MTSKSMHKLEAKNIVKTFGDTRALGGVDLELRSGEVHGLVGHNGAGKSTLLRIFSGSLRPDSGKIVRDAENVIFHTPSDALRRGVATVYQELSLLPNLTVAENTFLGSEKVALGTLKRRTMEQETEQLLRRFDLNVSPTRTLGELSIAQRQLIEIAVAVHRSADFLLLDEPTSSLEANQVERTLAWLKDLAEKEHIGMLFIGHKIDELLSICSKITVLADGLVQLHKNRNEFDRSDIIAAVMGKQKNSSKDSSFSVPEYSDAKSDEENVGNETAIRITNLRSNYLQGITLEAKRNRVLGLYGLVGSGRSRFLRTLIGIGSFSHGEVQLLNKPYKPLNPRDAYSKGVVFVTEDRKIDGFIPEMSAKKNTMLPVLREYEKMGWLDLNALDKEASRVLNELNVLGDMNGSMAQLSGGNQQKVLFARAIRQRPKILLLDEPTKGVDVGAKAEIYRLIHHLTRSMGICVVMVSSEEQEILQVADDVAVFRHGACDGKIYDPSLLDEAELRALAWHQEESEAKDESQSDYALNKGSGEN